MDKFLKRSFDGDYHSQFVESDFLHLAAQVKPTDKHVEKSNKRTTSESGWENYDTTNINFSCSSTGVKRPTTGWIVQNGERAYCTYRGGQKVIKKGREAMMLSMGDKKAKA